MNITANGNYTLTPKNHRFSSGTVYVSGDLGAATVVLNVLNNGELTPLTSGTLEIDEQYQVNHGKIAEIVAVITDSDGSTDFVLSYNGHD